MHEKIRITIIDTYDPMFKDKVVVYDTKDFRVVTIGRATKNTLVIPDPTVSRYHARIIFEDDKIYFEDLGSTNGSYILQGEEFKEIRKVKVEIGDNTIIKLGFYTIIKINIER